MIVLSLKMNDVCATFRSLCHTPRQCDVWMLYDNSQIIMNLIGRVVCVWSVVLRVLAVKPKTRIWMPNTNWKSCAGGQMDCYAFHSLTPLHATFPFIPIRLFLTSGFSTKSTYSISPPAQKYGECRFISMTNILKFIPRHWFQSHISHCKAMNFYFRKWEKTKQPLFFLHLAC